MSKFEVILSDMDDEGEEIGDDRQRLIVKHNGNEIFEMYDGGEPEDMYFFRDLDKIPYIIEESYRLGYEDGKMHLLTSQPDPIYTEAVL